MGTPQRRAGLFRLLALARPEARLLAVATFALFVGTALALAAPQGIRLMLDAVQRPDGLALLGAALGRLLAIFALLGAAGFVRAYLFTLAGERVVARLRASLFAHVLEQEVAFFDTRRTGDLLSLIASDTALLQNSVTVNVSMAIRFGLQVVGSLAVLFVTSPRLTLVMLSVVPVVTVGAIAFARSVRTLSQRAQEALGRASSVAEESIAGVRTVRSFAREGEEANRYAAAIGDVLAVGKRMALVYGLFQGAAGFAAYGALAAVLWYGGTLVVAGVMTVGELGAFLLYTLFMAVGLGGLSGLQGDYARALGAAARIFELLDRAPELPNHGGEPLAKGDVTLVFESVELRYPARPEHPALRDVSLSLEPGKVVALVGPSGSGKSSVASLALRFYDPTRGRIVVRTPSGDADLRSLDPTSWREAVSLVAQEPLLFATTIEENVRYGRLGASREDVRRALEAANALEFVDALPEGLETVVGERGVRMSGGQRQRLAIARALLKDPRVLVLDEATSALDAESEKLVQEALERLVRGRTVLVIAHRLSTVKDADRVVVLDKGKVVEEGTHAELVEKGGMYRRLVELQLVTDD